MLFRSLALEVADRIVVFYAGTTVEEAKVTDFADETLLRLSLIHILVLYPVGEPALAVPAPSCERPAVRILAGQSGDSVLRHVERRRISSSSRLSSWGSES